DRVGDVLVAASLGAGGNELLVPHVDLVEVGEPTLGEGPQEVERRGRLVVGPQEPLGIGPPGGSVEVDVVDHVATERGQLPPRFGGPDPCHGVYGRVSGTDLPFRAT